MKRTLLLSIVIGVIVILILIVYVVVSFYRRPSRPNTPGLVFPTPMPQQQTQRGTSRVQYDNKKSSDLLSKLANRQVLSDAGQNTKQRLKATLKLGAGTLYSSPNVTVGYLSATDQFQGQILSFDVKRAKQEAVNWMITQGFTKDDVCKLPLSFYLSSDATTQLTKTNYVFSPLPDGC